MQPVSSDVPAHYYDGVNAGRKAVRVILQRTELWIQGDTVDERWAFTSLRRVDRYAMSTLRLRSTTNDNARLIIFDPALANEVREKLPRNERGTRRKAKPATLIAWLLGSVAVLVALLVFGRLLARPVVAVMPLSWDKALGAAFVDRLLDDDELVRDRETLGVVQQMIKTITGNKRVDMEVYLERKPYINAIALPGGHIIVYCGLVRDLKSADELAGILAHEIAHVQERHSTEAMVRVLGASVLFGALVGDFGGVAGGAAETLDALISNAYSRRAELEADMAGIQMLRNAGLRSDGLASFFARRANDTRIDGKLTYISTHPSHASRAKATRLGRHGGKAALSDDEWRGLKDACKR